jgi:hypothetical protein
MPLVRLGQDALKGEIVVVLLKQSQPPGRTVPDVVHETVGALSWMSRHGRNLPLATEKSYVLLRPL